MLAKLKAIDRRLLTILAIVFVQIAGAALILPILPLFAEREFQLSPSAVTPLVSSYFIAVFFAGPLLGQLSDRYGRVPLLVISQIGSALSFFWMAAAGAAWMLFAARLLDGVTGGNIIVAQAYVTDVTPREKRTESLGYIFAAFGLAFIIGPALGGVLSAWFGPRVPFVIAGLASLLTAVMSWRLLNETTGPRARLAAAPGPGAVEAAASPPPARTPRAGLTPLQIVRNLPLLLIMLAAFIGQFGLGLLQSTFALYSDQVLFRSASPEQVQLGVGLILAVIGVGQFITQSWLIRPLKARLGDSRLVILGTALRAVGLSMIAGLLYLGLVAVGALLFAIGTGLMMPPLQSLATRTVGESVRGSVLGVYQSAVSLAVIISTFIAGTIFQVQPNLPYWIAAALSLLVLFPAFNILRLSRQGRLLPQPEGPNPP